MARKIKINHYYRHFKGTVYRVMAIAKDSETLEELVVYEHDGDVWVRPYEMFNSLVDHDKYPEVLAKYRFEEIE